MVKRERESSEAQQPSPQKAKVETSVDEEKEESDGGEEDFNAIVWIQCDACGKWRKWLVAKEAPEGSWYCQDNKWDAAHNSCDVEEEEQGEEELEEDGEDDHDEDEELTMQEIAKNAQREYEAKQEAMMDKKQRQAEERAAVKEERHKERMQREEQEAIALIASWTPEERATRSAAAKKKNNRKQFPVHLYPKQFNDKKATSLLMIDFLLGADIDAPDSMGRTPLHYAVIEDSELYEKFLLDKNVEPFACDHSDRCPDEYRRIKQPKCMWDKFI